MISDELADLKLRIDDRLEELLENASNERLYEAMSYSVLGGGKRLRPALCLMSAAMFTEDTSEILDIACALEMIHAFSLIHDDLPCMDNDTLRRGQPTCHVKFGEATALLAGDGLVNLAYKTMVECAAKSENERILSSVEVIAHAVDEMIAGQTADIMGENTTPSEMRRLHSQKTGELITAAVLSGMLPFSKDPEHFEAFAAYGENLGLAFQIVDDCLDVRGGDIGKTAGKDAKQGKITFASYYGVQTAMDMAEGFTKKAIESLEIFDNADELTGIAEFLLKRAK